jgi:hypothetical protein
MKEYKLIKVNDDLDVSMLKCANPRVGMVFLSDCVECNKYKGMSSLKKHVKCSFEYDTQEPEEYDTDNVEEHGCIERVLPEEPKELPKVGEKWRVRTGLENGAMYNGCTFWREMEKNYIIIDDIVCQQYYRHINGGIYSLEMLDGKYEEPKEQVNKCHDCRYYQTGSPCNVCCDYEYFSKIDCQPKEVADEEPKDEKSCDNCEYRNQGWYSKPCDTCTRGITQQKISSNWKPKIANKKPITTEEFIAKHSIADVEPEVEKVKKYKYICKKCMFMKCIVINDEKLKPSHCTYGCDVFKWKLKGKA